MSDPNRPGETTHEDYEPTQRIERPSVGGSLFADEDRAGRPAPGDTQHAERTEAFESFDSMLASSSVPLDDQPAPRPRQDRPSWLVPAILGALVVLLLAAAYGIGRAVSGQMSAGAATAQQSDGLVMGESGTAAPKQHEATGKKYDGRTDAAPIGGASATCQAASGVDAAGHAVDYAPANAVDGDMTTAWRCDGNGVGQKLTLNLDGDTSVGEVGLVPGYAKTDPRSGADRYAENDRITKVRWVFDDGTTVVQDLDGSARNREIQSIRIPVTRTGHVVVEVLASTPGPRNTVAISEVRVGKTA